MATLLDRSMTYFGYETGEAEVSNFITAIFWRYCGAI